MDHKLLVEEDASASVSDEPYVRGRTFIGVVLYGGVVLYAVMFLIFAYSLGVGMVMEIHTHGKILMPEDIRHEACEQQMRMWRNDTATAACGQLLLIMRSETEAGNIPTVERSVAAMLSFGCRLD